MAAPKKPTAKKPTQAQKKAAAKRAAAKLAKAAKANPSEAASAATPAAPLAPATEFLIVPVGVVENIISTLGQLSLSLGGLATQLQSQSRPVNFGPATPGKDSG